MAIFMTILPQRSISYAATTMTASNDNGLRIQFFGSTWGLSGYWTSTDLIGTTRTTRAYYDFIQATDVLRVERGVLKRTRIDGFIRPRYTERYTFNTNANNDLKLWINDELVINYGYVVDIELTAGLKYKIELELQQNRQEEIQIKWSSASQTEEVIPSSRLFAPTTTESIPNNRIIKGYINPSQDIDRDGIPDSWEKNGYTVVEGIIMPYDKELHTVKYITNPNEASTDGDPYSDFVEVTGIGMDQSVKAPGNHPLVPAYPIVEFVPTSVNITPSVTNASSRSLDIGISAAQDVTSVNLSTDISGGYRKENTDSRLEIGSKYEANSLAKTSYVGTYYKIDQSGGVTWNSRQAATEEAKKIEGSKISESIKYGSNETVSIDTTNYAYLQVNGYYKNSGTATAHKVRPYMSLNIAGEDFTYPSELGEDGQSAPSSTDVTVRSFEVISGQRPNLIGPDVNYPANGNIALNLTSSNSGFAPENIVLNKAQVDKLELGYPFRVLGTYRSYIGNNKNQSTDRWSYYINRLNKKSATITLALPNQEPIERKIYAGDANMEMNLLQALEILFDAKTKIRNGRTNLVIDGEEITPNLYSEWGIRVKGSAGEAGGSSPLDQFIAGLAGATSYKDILLKPEISLYIYKKDNAAKASILSAYYNPNDSKIYSVVIPGTENLKSVEAKVKDETVKTLNMTKVDGTSFEYVSDTVYNISTLYNNEIVARSESDKETKARIFIDTEYLKSRAKEGLNYLEFPSDLNKRPFASEADLTAVKNYVQSTPENKYYTVMIGENKLNEVGDNQGNRSITLGKTELYNQVQYRVKDNGRFFRGGTVDMSLLLDVWSRYTNSWLSIDLDSRDDGSVFGKWPSTYLRTGDTFRGTEVKRIPNGQVVETKVKLKDGTKVSPIVTLYTNNKLDPRNIKNKFPKLANWSDNTAFVYEDLNKYLTSSPAVHTQFTIVSREDLLSYLKSQDGFWNTNGLVINGMYTENVEAQVFIPKFAQYSTATSGINDITIDTTRGQRPDAVMLTLRKKGTDPGKVTFGGNVVELNTGNASDYHEDLIIADVKSDGNIDVAIPSGKSVDYQVMGYFIGKTKLLNQQKYWQYWIPEKTLKRTILPEYGKETTTLLTVKSSSMNVNGYPVKPKAYMVKVDVRYVGADSVSITINGRNYRMDVGHKIGSAQYNPINHTGYIMVPVGLTNPYNLETVVNTLTPENEGTPGQIDFEVVGFFYENLY